MLKGVAVQGLTWELMRLFSGLRVLHRGVCSMTSDTKGQGQKLHAQRGKATLGVRSQPIAPGALTLVALSTWSTLSALHQHS